MRNAIRIQSFGSRRLFVCPGGIIGNVIMSVFVKETNDRSDTLGTEEKTVSQKIIKQQLYEKVLRISCSR